MTPKPFDSRMARVQAALAGSGADWLIVPASADLHWLTGAHARVTERLVALVVPGAGAPFLVAPRLEAGPLAAEVPGIEMLVWDEHEDPLTRLAERASLTRDSRVRLAEGLGVRQVLRLTELAACAPAGAVIAAARAIKDAQELAMLAEAARHADQVVLEAAAYAQPGMSEREIERFIFARFEALGDTAPWALVASGPNSASPHHHTSDRRLEDDDVLLLDLGATTAGYHSDITRTFCMGEPSRQLLRVFEVVDAARTAGIAAARTGATAQGVDAAARGVIEAAGLGEYFTHRTGHGIGLEIHEPPYLVAGNSEVLAAGMVHSVEPGIYLPGRFGVRLEDIVVVEAGGGRRLNAAPFDLRVTGSPR